MDKVVKFIHCVRSKSRVATSVSPGLSVSVVRVPSPVESFYFLEGMSSNGHKTCRVKNDVYMLFNQQRLDKMTKAALLDYLNSSKASDDGLSALRSKVPPEKLCDYVKSRYIQSPSELRAWSDYLSTVYDTEISSISSQFGDSSASEPAQSDPGQSNSSPE